MRISRKQLIISIFNAFIIIAVLLAFFMKAEFDANEGAGVKGLSPMSWPIFLYSPSLNAVVSGRKIPAEPDILWSFNTLESVIGTPVVDKGTVFIGSLDKHLYALNLKDGELKWKTELNGDIEASPLVYNDTVYVGTKSGQGTMYALKTLDGSILWSFPTKHNIIGSANMDTLPEGKTGILFGSHDNYMYCVDSLTGELIWEFKAENYINGAPAVSQNICVFGGCDANVYGVSTLTGQPAAVVETGSYIAGSAAMKDGKIYVGNYDGELMCVSLEPGKVEWVFENESGEPFFGTPAAGEKLVYAGSRDTNMYALDRAAGKEVWRFKTKGAIDSSPVVTESNVIFGSDDGRLYVLNRDDGTLVWEYEIGEEISGAPALLDGMIIIGCRDGGIYAISDRVDSSNQ